MKTGGEQYKTHSSPSIMLPTARALLVPGCSQPSGNPVGRSTHSPTPARMQAGAVARHLAWVQQVLGCPGCSGLLGMLRNSRQSPEDGKPTLLLIIHANNPAGGGRGSLQISGLYFLLSPWNARAEFKLQCLSRSEPFPLLLFVQCCPANRTARGTPGTAPVLEPECKV